MTIIFLPVFLKHKVYAENAWPGVVAWQKEPGWESVKRIFGRGSFVCRDLISFLTVRVTSGNVSAYSTLHSSKEQWINNDELFMENCLFNNRKEMFESIYCFACCFRINILCRKWCKMALVCTKMCICRCAEKVVYSEDEQDREKLLNISRWRKKNRKKLE